MSSYIVAAVGAWNRGEFEQRAKILKGEWYFCDTPEKLNQLLERIKPRYIFFPHWRWIVASQILKKYECVCFHMTDVPYGRGGSPLQNLIVRGHKDTVLSALKMTDEIDAGPVYMKKKLKLTGSAKEIFQRASILTWEIIEELIQKEPLPKSQTGEAVFFKRRKPEESLIPKNMNLEQVYDYIRMLDAPDYPKAFLEINGYRLEFEGAELVNNALTARVRIVKI